MRKSEFGKKTRFFWEGFLPVDDVGVFCTDSTLRLRPDLEVKVAKEWQKVTEKNPHAFDGLKWRTESIKANKFKSDPDPPLKIMVSPTRYSVHNALRHVDDKPVDFYPNPLTVNTIQETADGYIALGVRGKTSDQRGLALLGSGFVERYQNADGTDKAPERLGYVVQKECLEETKYDKKLSFTMADARALAVVFGSNHDTTVGVHLPVFATSKELHLGNDEHSDLVFLPNNPETIRKVLKQGKHKGIPLADHALGCLEAYVGAQERCDIKSSYYHGV